MTDLPVMQIYANERTRARGKLPPRGRAHGIQPQRRDQITMAGVIVGTSSPTSSFPGGFRTGDPVQTEPSRWAVDVGHAEFDATGGAAAALLRSLRSMCQASCPSHFRAFDAEFFLLHGRLNFR
jgi:hypothetical protein